MYLTDKEKAERIKTFVAMYNEGKSILNISKVTGSCTEFIRKSLVNEGLEIRGVAKISEEEKEQIYQKYLEGFKIGRIAEDFKRSTSSISNILTEKKANYEYKSKAQIKEEEIGFLPDIPRYKVKRVPAEPVKDGFGCIVGFDVSMLYGIECPKKFDVPEWKIEFEKQGIVNYGYGYFPKEVCNG